MSFQKTVDLWNPETQTAVINGDLKLKVGQWVQCGPGPKSRFVCVRPSGTLWVIHKNGDENQTTVGFSERVKTLLGK